MKRRIYFMPLYRLDPNKVPVFWDLIKPGLILGKNISGVDGSHDFANTVLEQALAGACQIWLGFEAGEATGDNYIGFMVTYAVTDIFSKKKDFVIYFLYTFKSASAALQGETAISIFKYAKALKCSKVVTYTENPRLEQYVKDRLGQHVRDRHMFYVRLEEL
jgi:hypothetical protein